MAIYALFFQVGIVGATKGADTQFGVLYDSTNGTITPFGMTTNQVVGLGFNVSGNAVLFLPVYNLREVENYLQGTSTDSSIGNSATVKSYTGGVGILADVILNNNGLFGAGAGLGLSAGVYQSLPNSNETGFGNTYKLGSVLSNIVNGLLPAANAAESEAVSAGASTSLSIDYAIASESEATIGVGHVASITSSGNYVLLDGTVIPASAVTSVSYQNGNSTLTLATNSAGNATGAGIAVVQGTSSATVTNLGSGNQVTVAGTVDTSSLQPAQPVAVTTSAGTYHIDSATGNITDQGAIAATIGGNTVTIITPTEASDNGIIPPPFAVLQSNSASASSIVLAYPQGPVARTATRSHRRRVGSLGISHDRGSARTNGGAHLWGFIRQQGGGGSDRCRRNGVRGRSLARKADGFVGAEHRSGTIGIVNSISAMSAAHTQRLPGRIGPVTMSLSHDRTAHERSHDVSLGFGGLG